MKKNTLLTITFLFCSLTKFTSAEIDARAVGLSVSGTGVSLAGAALIYDTLKNKKANEQAYDDAKLTKLKNACVFTGKIIAGTGMVMGGAWLAVLSKYFIEELDNATRPARTQNWIDSWKETFTDMFIWSKPKTKITICRSRRYPVCRKYYPYHGRACYWNFPVHFVH